MWVNLISQVDDTRLSIAGVSEQQEQRSSPPTWLPLDEPPTNSLLHNFLQILRAELQRHQDITTSLKAKRDTLSGGLDQRRDSETSRLCLAYLFAIHLTNAWPKQNSEMFKESSSEENNNASGSEG